MNLKLQTAFDQFLVQQDVTEIKTENKTQPNDYIQLDKIYNSINFILYFATNHNKTRRKIKII
jgi:hypothetical protein